jgi:hypothetical protein
MIKNVKQNCFVCWDWERVGLDLGFLCYVNLNCTLLFKYTPSPNAKNSVALGLFVNSRSRRLFWRFTNCHYFFKAMLFYA